MISFKARYIDKVNVLQLADGGNTYKDSKVSFVELLPYSLTDESTLKKISGNWSLYGNTYADSMAQDFSCFYADRSYYKQFFALTAQKGAYAKLNPDEVLGLAQVRQITSKKCYLDYLQTAPNYAYTSAERIYKMVGASMLDMLKKYYKDMEIGLYSTLSAIDFYVKQGFKVIGENKILLYKPPKI